MLTRILRKLALGLLTLWGATVLVFAGTEVLPGDLASAVLQTNATPEALAQTRRQLGLDRPAVVRYWEWLSHAARGDFGHSLTNRRDVAQMVAPRALNTFFLATYAAVIAIPLAIGLGLLSAMREGGAFDRGINVVTLAAISVPEYFLAYLLIKYLAIEWGLFLPLANVGPRTPFFERLYLTFLPMLTLVLVVVAHMMRMTRASVLAVIARPFIEMAFLKGLPRWRVVLRHAFPNALGPIINVVALDVAYLITGVVVVEAVFVYPGLGQLMVDSVAKHDVPVVQACGLVFASVFIVLNTLADVAATASDPRLRHPR